MHTLWAVCLLTFAISTHAMAQQGVRWRTFEEERAGYYTAKIVVPEFTGSTQVAKFANTQIRRVAERTFQEFIANARAFGRSGKPVMPWALDGRGTIAIHRPNLISVSIETFDYSGGAHPNLYISTHTFTDHHGSVRVLRLRDVLRSSVTVTEFVARVLLPALNEAKVARGALRVDQFENMGLADKFVVTPTALVWQFAPYDVGAYAEGRFTVKLPYAQIAAELNPVGPLGNLFSSDAATTGSLDHYTIRGTFTYRERILLPPGTKVEFRLVASSATTGGGPLRVLETLTVPFERIPQEFEFPVQGSSLRSNGKILLEILLRHDDKVWFRSPANLEVRRGLWDDHNRTITLIREN